MIAPIKERPILFSAPMILAILDDIKTQTRRVMRSQPHAGAEPIRVGPYCPTVVRRDGEEVPGPKVFGAYSEDGEWGLVCPYGRPGERLWVRETWCSAYGKLGFGVLTAADGMFTLTGRHAEKGPHFHAEEVEPRYRWRPSIHMPRWASRIDLEVTVVRVERIQDISEEDAKAEGVPSLYSGDTQFTGSRKYAAPGVVHTNVYGDHDTEAYCHKTAKKAYEVLWDEINGDREGCSWAENPWVWCVEFRRVRP